LDQFIPPAYAQTLVLPRSATVTQAQLGNAERAAIQAQVQKSYAEVTGKAAPVAGPEALLTGSSGLTYVQRIQLISSLESSFQLKIPDDHWQQMRTLGQLVDYVEKRKQLEKSLASRAKLNDSSWAQIQQKFPLGARPVYTQ
jgi:acyl carrier protein